MRSGIRKVSLCSLPLTFCLMLALVLTACAPMAPPGGAPQQPAQQPAKEVVISFVPGGNYYPAEPTEDNPHPPTALKTIVAEYEEAHPGIKIELVEMPSGVMPDTWRITVFQGGTEPHILINNYIRVWQEQVNDWYIPLNEYLQEPNPYIPEGMPGHDRWQDSIPDVVWDTTLHSTGNQYLITMDAVAVGMFYNKEIFQKVGLPTELKTPTSLWANWEEMLDAMAKLKDAGYQPLALSMHTASPWNYNWVDGIVLTSVFYDLLPEMYEPARADKWHVLSQQEVSCAIHNGILSATDPRFSDFVDILSEFQQYWIAGYPTMTTDETYRAFINQEVPILLTNASADISRVLRDAKFDFGVTYFPPLNGATSPFAENVKTSFLVGGFTAGYAITERAEREGILPETVDFLKFLTAQPQWSRIVQDAPRAVPTLKGLDVPESLQSLTAFLELPMRAFKDPNPRLSKRYGEEHRRLMQEYFTGQITKDELIQAEDKLMKSEAEKVIAENGWSCGF